MKFKSLEVLDAFNGGTEFIVINDKDRDRDNDGLTGSKVAIDGKEYLIKGVETLHEKIIHARTKIGLVVSERPGAIIGVKCTKCTFSGQIQDTASTCPRCKAKVKRVNRRKILTILEWELP